MADRDILQISDEFRDAVIRGERSSAVRLTKAYGAVWSKIYAQLVVINQQIREAREGGETVNPAWLYRQERYQRLLSQIEQEFRSFSISAGKEITDGQERAVMLASDQAVEIAAVAGVEASFTQLPKSAFRSMIGFLGDGSPLSTLLNELPGDGRRIVEEGLTHAVAQGWNPRKTAAVIRAGLGGNLDRALLISRTETLRAFRESSRQNFIANRDVISGWYWRSARNGKSCAACIALDGTFHPVEEPMKSHPNCRCTQIPALPGVNPGSGADWFEKQPEAIRKQIISNQSTFDALQSGQIQLTDLVGLKRNALWGDHYYQLGTRRALNGEGRFPGDSVPVGVQVADMLKKFRPR